MGGVRRGLIGRGERLLELIDAVPEPSEDDLRRREQAAERIASWCSRSRWSR
ncbi:hypothetical protein [Streptomyces sp. 7N604]|uniref:hypothetical protein n=1 Tax=Streptomyces sp. 7N604 TaxID=3457415 RepID=UPI003FD4E2B8